ncbi:MAG: zinc ribbon domain-containing protein [Proteobacteria bacterium]|nr:zinc ribbon domain-containing protein [Pseudomonadota bacterium]
MKTCRECGHQVSDHAISCPGCGAPYPAKEKWDGWGYEYKSKTILWGLPLVHISFKFRPNRMPVPAKGILAIGQFAAGVVTISQFGLGIFSLSQFALAVYAIAQIGVAYSLIAQIGLYINTGYGQVVRQIGALVAP